MSFEGHELSIDDIKKILDTSDDYGLNNEQIESKTKIYGLNELPVKKISVWKIYLAPLFNIMITIYIIAIAFYFILAIWNANALYEASATLLLIGANFAVSVIQQYRSTKKIDALHKLATPTCKVIRNGELQILESKYLVPGDIIELATGDRIPADARLIEAHTLEVNESILTGESEPVEKLVILEGTTHDISISQRVSMIYQGTYVQTGNGKAIVVKTGSLTQIGQINDGLNQVETKEIHLVKKINSLGLQLTLVMLIMLSITVLVRIYDLYRINSLDNIYLVSQYLTQGLISTLSIIPINIPILITIILATGVYSMAVQKVVIKNLSSIESLGRISVLCSDKTGTITKGQMTASIIYDLKNSYDVLVKGHDPGVSFVSDEYKSISQQELFTIMGSPFSFIKENSNLELILLDSFLNNDSKLIIDDYLEVHGRSWKATGNPTDAALMNLVKSAGVDDTTWSLDYQLLFSYPFDSRLKLMSKIFIKNSTNLHICFTKGAVEYLLERCKYISKGDIQSFAILDDQEKSNIYEKINSYGALGYRIIGFGFKTFLENELTTEKMRNRPEIEKDLIFLGFVCLIDPPREFVETSVDELYSAGITPIMITGDSQATAVTIASKIGIFKEGSSYFQGHLPGDYPEETFNKTVVYSRVSPKDKVEIVKRYQKQNRIVAMTGDGVNDALALMTADVGVAMGISGTELTKQSADMVISDDSFNSVVKGIREGRSLFYKVRVIMYFYLAVCMAEGLLYFVTGLDPRFALLTYWQTAYIFLFTHAIPPMGLIFDRKSKDIMKERPLDSAEILNKNLLISLLIFIGSFSAVLVIGYVIGLSIGVNKTNLSFFYPILSHGNDVVRALPRTVQEAKARTYFLTIIYISECLLILSLRRMNMNVLKGTIKDGWWFIYLCSFILLVWHVLVMYVPFIQDRILGSSNIQIDIIALDPLDWLICIILGLIPILAIELQKKYVRNHNMTF